MIDYQPSAFASLAKTELGRRLWELLNDPETVSRMETATD